MHSKKKNTLKRSSSQQITITTTIIIIIIISAFNILAIVIAVTIIIIIIIIIEEHQQLLHASAVNVCHCTIIYNNNTTQSRHYVTMYLCTSVLLKTVNLVVYLPMYLRRNALEIAGMPHCTPGWWAITVHTLRNDSKTAQASHCTSVSHCTRDCCHWMPHGLWLDFIRVEY